MADTISEVNFEASAGVLVNRWLKQPQSRLHFDAAIIASVLSAKLSEQTLPWYSKMVEEAAGVTPGALETLGPRQWRNLATTAFAQYEPAGVYEPSSVVSRLLEITDIEATSVE